jgi:HEAT repeat protein
MRSLKIKPGYGERMRQAVDGLPPRFRKAALADLEALEKRAPTLSALIDLAEDVDAASRHRARAVWALGVVRPRAISKLLLNILRERRASEIVLWEAAKALVKIEPRGAMRELVSLVERGTPLQRAVAAWTLGYIGAPAAREVLEHALAQDRSARVREHAAEALGAVGTPASTPRLIAATRAAAPDVRFSAAFALGQIGDPRALATLQGLAGDHTMTRSRRTVSAAARAAIRKIRTKSRNSAPAHRGVPDDQ